MGIFINQNSVKLRVRGGQGCPQAPDQQCGPAKTSGSSMKSRVHAQAASGSAFSRSVSSGAIFWIALFAVLTVFGLSSTMLRAESANAFFKRGQSAEAREDYDGAVDNYQKAYKKEPKDIRYRAALYRVRITASSAHVTKGEKLLAAGQEQAALSEFLHAAEIDPSNEAAQQAIARVRQKHGEVAPAAESSLPVAEGKQEDLESMSSPVVLKPLSNEPLTLHMQEDSKVVYQAVGKAAGVNILFDPEFVTKSKRIQVDLNNVLLGDALRIVGTISNTFWRPVTDNTIFIAENTKARHTELDEQAVQTFYLSNAWQQNDLTDVQTAIRNLLPTAKVYGVASQNAIVMRGTPDELLLAEKLVNDLDRARPEVVVDISVLEVSKNWQKTLGMSWPSSVGVALQSPTASTTTTSSTSTSTTTSPTLYDLSHLKASDFAVTVGSATANLLLTDTDTKILQNPRIRATDGQKAVMKIGSKIPIATGSYGGGTTGTLAGISSMVNTQFQYQDVGVNIEMTPTVHFDRDVTLKIKIEVTAQSGSVTISSVTEPIISQRTVDQVIRLREGEASILGGIEDDQDTVTWTGIPGLSSIPGLKYLFGSKNHQIQDDDLVFLIVPHVVRTQSLEQLNLRTVDTGTQATVQLRHVPNESPAANPAGNPAANPAGNPTPAPAAPPARMPGRARSNVGSVPGQSAVAAAPAALEQIHQAAQTNGNQTPAAAPPVAPPGAPPSDKVSFAFTSPAGPVAPGATFQLPVVLSGGADIASVPLQISYEPDKLSLVNVDLGDFLGKDGQAVALVHRDDPPGAVNINVSRPPGAAGVSGGGVVCVLTFQAKAAGESSVVITHPGARTSTQQELPALGARVGIQVK
jgi:general secretion pathway protein D